MKVLRLRLWNRFQFADGRLGAPRMRFKGFRMYSAIYSTDDVDGQDGDEYWRGVMHDKFRTSFERASTGQPYRAVMACHSFEGFTMARMHADGQRSRRTSRQINADDQAYFMASVVMNGNGQLEQHGRVATLQPGSVTYWDTSRPATWHFDGAHDALLLRIPHERVALYSSTRRLLQHTAGTRSRHGALGVAADFFLQLSSGSIADPSGTAVLARQGAGILASSLALIAGADEHATVDNDELLRKQVLSYLRRHLGEPGLTPDSIARAVNVSRRSLYRLFEAGEAGETSVMGTLRRLRVERAKELLVSHPHRTVRDVGAFCGFNDGQFPRAFRELVEMSPAEYRAAYARPATSDA